MAELNVPYQWRAHRLPGESRKPWVVVRTLSACGALVTAVEPHVDAIGHLIHFASQSSALATARRINNEHDEQRRIFTASERLL